MGFFFFFFFSSSSSFSRVFSSPNLVNSLLVRSFSNFVRMFMNLFPRELFWNWSEIQISFWENGENRVFIHRLRLFPTRYMRTWRSFPFCTPGPYGYNSCFNVFIVQISPLILGINPIFKLVFEEMTSENRIFSHQLRPFLVECPHTGDLRTCSSSWLELPHGLGLDSDFVSDYFFFIFFEDQLELTWTSWWT